MAFLFATSAESSCFLFFLSLLLFGSVAYALASRDVSVGARETGDRRRLDCKDALERRARVTPECRRRVDMLRCRMERLEVERETLRDDSNNVPTCYLIGKAN